MSTKYKGPGIVLVIDTHDPSRGGTRCVYGYWSKT
jgi:hypothetical protein